MSTPRLAVMIPLLGLTLSACSADSPEDCARLPEDAAEQCYIDTVLALWATDPVAAEAWLPKLTPVTRDYLLYTITQQHEPNTLRLCREIENPQIAETCTKFVQRPHMHRHTIRDEKGGPEGEGLPPEGGGPPPGGPGGEGAGPRGPGAGGPGGPGGPGAGGPGGPRGRGGPGRGEPPIQVRPPPPETPAP
ncbi:hypothetical protein L6R49_07390 [Myxococcota bacterium]|nr:hypothetical protein [Myxococcota bacterium]